MEKICKVDLCENKIICRGYCYRHYKQIQMFGKIKRTRIDPNEIIIKEDHAEVILYNNVGIERNRTLIDLEDVSIASKIKWCYKEGYASAKSGNKTISLHRTIMNPPEGMVVDHINHDTLDNRKENLRICTVQQNNWNSKSVKGVYYREDRGRWRAKLSKSGKVIELGYFDTEEEASRARRKAEIKYFGEYAPYKESINE